MPINPAVLVVGGGIAGIQAALTLADAGKQVFLVEREPSIGGHMAMFDKTFPTLDCAACILTPKMTAVQAPPEHHAVDLLRGRRRSRATWATTRSRSAASRATSTRTLCVGCMECIEACVYKQAKFPDEFDLGLGMRKPVYIPFPQAVPPVVGDRSRRPASSSSRGKCKKTCVEACGERNAIDFTQTGDGSRRSRSARSSWPPASRPSTPSGIPYYGYGNYPNVYTALEVERLVNAVGPTGGEVVLRDGATPQDAWASSTASAAATTTPTRYCSRVCCMYSLKLAHLVKEKTGAEVYNFYIDMRTPGKGVRGVLQPGRRTRACTSSAARWPTSTRRRQTATGG